MFVYIVISPDGVPIFQYPTNLQEHELKIDINTALFGGLIAALNTYSVETAGNQVGEVTFGSLVSTFSRDKDGKIHVVLTDGSVELSLNKMFHVEIKTLFLANEHRLSLSVPGEASLHSIPPYPDTAVIEEVFDPFYKLWKKKVAWIRG